CSAPSMAVRAAVTAIVVIHVSRAMGASWKLARFYRASSKPLVSAPLAGTAGSLGQGHQFLQPVPRGIPFVDERPDACRTIRIVQERRGVGELIAEIAQAVHLLF